MEPKGGIMSGNETGIETPLDVWATWPNGMYGSSDPDIRLLARYPDALEPAAAAPQSWQSLGLPVWQGIAASMTDGHLEGLWNTPPTLGEIKDNILYGGGLAPVEWLHGPRTVTYVYYVGAGTVAEVWSIVKEHKRMWSWGPLAVNHHGLGWLNNGHLAAPVAVEWLTRDHEAVAKVTATVTFADPYLTGVDTRHARITGRFKYSAIDGESEFLPGGSVTVDGWNTGESSVTVYANNLLKGADTYVYIGVKRPEGQASNKTLAFGIWSDTGGQSQKYYLDTGSTYATGIAIIDGSNPNVVYRTNDTFYTATWKDGKVPPPDFFKLGPNQQKNWFIFADPDVFPNGITAVEAGLISYSRQF